MTPTDDRDSKARRPRFTARKKATKKVSKLKRGDAEAPPDTGTPTAQQLDIAGIAQTPTAITAETPPSEPTPSTPVKTATKRTRTRKKAAKRIGDAGSVKGSVSEPDDRSPAARVPSASSVADHPADIPTVQKGSAPPAKETRRSGKGEAAPKQRTVSRANRKTGVADSDAPALEQREPRRSGRKTTGRSPRVAKTGSGAATSVSPSETKDKTSRGGRGTKAAADKPVVRSADAVGGAREMVINVTGGDECRIAILQRGRLEDLFIERSSSQAQVGNIYKGRVTNVEPSIQAVFVDFGGPKNGFLHISDVQSQYFPENNGEPEDVGRKIPRHHRPAIQQCFRRGQEVMVQVTKEGVGTKGPTLTTYLSIPGRFLVMMPGMRGHGVSRKIEDDAHRRDLRDLLNELKLPSDMGFIVRTAGQNRSKRDLQRDLNYLLRLWKTVVSRVKRLAAPTELYQESDLVTRTIRDVYTADFKRVVVDDPDTARKVTEFLQIAMPRSKAVVDLYTEREPLFYRLGIEQEIERINMRQVPLPLGGSLVIDSTEALVAIDVNSGRFRAIDDAEETALRINIEAAEEIARQLRLRDLGGLIVCDFIDMRLDRNKRAVERSLRDALKAHKERARTLRMSAFGLIEMTRQRQGPSIKRNIYFDCPHCNGAGMVKLPESVVLDVMRIVQLAAHQTDVQRVTVTVGTDVAFQILNRKRATINEIEAETGKVIIVRGDSTFTSDQIEYACEDSQGHPVTVGKPSADSTSRSKNHSSPHASRAR